MIRSDVFQHTGPQAPADSFHFIGCPFCDDANQNRLFATENFYVRLDASPLVEGHLLIVSAGHFGCAGEIPPHLHAELDGLVDRAQKLLQRAYPGQQFIYEHGRAGHCSLSSSILCHHFHLHILPAAVNALPALDRRFRGLPWKRVSDIPELFALHGDYLLVKNSSFAGRYYPATGTIESHFLRTLVARDLGAPERADWESWSDPAAVARARIKLQDCLKKRLS